MNAVDYIASELKRRGLSLFSFPGGTIYPLYNACQRAGVRVIVARSETGAAFAAGGAARATGQVQICAATSGPGAGGLVNGVMDAWFDAVPVIFLTGQVGTSALNDTLRTGKRQEGFQQTPTVKIMEPITVKSYLPLSPRMLIESFARAMHECVSGDRAGPVIVDMPMDIQRSEVDYTPLVYKPVEPPAPLTSDIDRVVALLRAAKRPVIIAGAGCLPASYLLRNLVYRCEIPVASSLPAVGIIPTDEPLWLGMIGHTGHPHANKAVQESDLILALGTRLDVRQTGTEVVRFAPNAKIVRVDTSPIELSGARVRQDVTIRADCAAFIKALRSHKDLPTFDTEIVKNIPAQHDEVAGLIMAISRAAPADCIFTTGVGAHQQHAARWLDLDYPRRMFLTSAGHGCMGAGLPMAIGAALATGRKAIVIDGDGSFQMTMNELGTIKRYGLQDQIEVHIIDNGSGGIVSQFARLQGWEPDETTWGAGNPDFEMIARTYGLSVNVHRVKQEGVWPILEGGRTMDDMTGERRTTEDMTCVE